MSRRLSLVCLFGLTLMVLAIPPAAAGGGCHPNPGDEMTTSTDPYVAISGCAYVDTVVYIEPGDEVTWANKDPVPHTVSGAAFSWGNERLLDESDKVSYTFADEGVYPYYCALHPSMVGAVVVGDPTKPAAITNGMAEVKEAAAGATTEVEGASATKTDSAAGWIGLAILATLAAAFVTARLLDVRRRAASAVPAP